MEYKRILLKLSGEALMGSQQYGIDPKRLSDYACEIKSIVEKKVQVGIVIGGGNIFRGLQGAGEGMDRVQGDYMGMLATTINSLALQGALEKSGVKTKILSGLPIEPIAEAMSRRTANDYLEEGKVVIISGGTGNPFFTTDSAAALRATELGAEIVLKGTKVDGVYDKDPMLHDDAVKYENITFTKILIDNIRVMDLTAITLCKENKLPIRVFNINNPGDLKKLVLGSKIGTLVSE